MSLPFYKKPDTAFALIIVLFTVVLLVILVIGLFTISTNRTRSSSLTMSVLDTDIAAETALNLVQAQIQEATSSGIDSNGTATEAWASQPGAIRTYDTSGTLTEIYKLYSSTLMKTASKDFIKDKTDIPSDWNKHPDKFVDINEPVKRRGDWLYPIAHPDSLMTVEGFSSSLADDPATEWNDSLAMPVRWLYLSKDGTLSTDPTTGNPVARVAFWTDDESCKINVNTASATDSSSYWDIPRATLKQDIQEMALRQPAQNEYNRYPGHPATISLTTVFPDLNHEGNGWLHKLIDTTPRYEWGGSKNGTVTIGSTRDPILNTKQNRIYATMDEYLYAPDRSVQLNLNEDKLEQARFFLTASSRSSELNLFGQPRVTIWPIHAENDDLHRTAFDQLIAHCSTIGVSGNQRYYYFTRSNSQSQTEDWNLHNQTIFEYLRNLTERDIPGFGGNFKDKYDSPGNDGVAGERDQILVSIFDLIRCANLNETYSGLPKEYKGYTTMLRNYVTGDATNMGRDGGDQDTFSGAGFVLPIETPYGRGAGRMPVVSEIGLWFIQTVDPNNPPPLPNPNPKIQPGIIVETNTPMQGLMPWQPLRRSIQVSPIDSDPLPLINGVPLPTGNAPTSSYSPNSGVAASQTLGGTNGWAWLMLAANTFADPNDLLTKTGDAIPAPHNEINITQGSFAVHFLINGVIVQTYQVKIPSATIPLVPDPVPATPITAGNRAGMEGWGRRNPYSNMQPTFWPEDVVQSVTLRDGDVRVAAYLETVSTGFFTPHPNFGSQRFAHGFRTSFGQMDNGSSNGNIINLTYGSASHPTKLGDGRTLELAQSAQPDIPAGIISLQDKGWDGDFDNGYGAVIDGAYLGKPDEGALNWKVQTNEADEAPYFHPYWKLGDGLFSPLRQMPSPVAFGSLPTGVRRTQKAYEDNEPNKAAPWRTLAFSPNPENPNHFGIKQSPHDHLLLDLFAMPCVEPYAISEPFSMAGRLNMNYGMIPFTYIERSTPMYAALAAQKIIAIPDSAAGIYKTTPMRNANDNLVTRLPIDIHKTLDQWKIKFENGDIFRSASEICEQFLVPQGATLSDVQSSWWNDYRLTGDNSRERPYATLYPLLTTRSSTFTMHFRSQAIKRLPNGDISVLAEKRGSQLFERYLDPNDVHIGNGKIDPNKVSLEPYFRFRTLLTKRFDP